MPRLPDQWRNTVRHAPVAQHRHGRRLLLGLVGIVLLAGAVIVTDILRDLLSSGRPL